MMESATFTPAEAARISGVNVTLQRDWRRRGFLPKEAGHAKFDLLATAELLGLNALAQRGIGPSQAKAVSRTIAAGIVTGALRYRDAWSGDPESFLRRFHRGNSDLAADLAIAGEYHPTDRDDYVWSVKARHLTRSALKSWGMGTYDIYQDVCYWWADGSVEFYRSAIQALEQIEHDDPRLLGAAILMDMRSLGVLLQQRAGRPLIDCQPPESIGNATDGQP